ncbi:FAD-dependent monooxygenase [Nocardia jinanensis]|uniref:FAD-dependent oxidoreductase n=1 Tax=Nocardia jinanensis TaxID=382504 RepID=A0A917RUF9_9NOCA|nr:FAD-dependent monooxygenase [Nocardia jinanensis]GGL34505.1 FAD-dependent oxidoreductase [Nocardia jinanensis]
MQNRTVLVSGASIAGPALAYWLDHHGFDVTVVERAPALRRGGQAVDFKGSVQRTVLERMGVYDEIRRRSTGATDMVFVDAGGREQARMSGDFTGGDVEILRGDLARILYELTARRCAYVFGDSISALRETADDVEVEFEQGPPRRFDLVIGADGIHSRVRRLAFGPEEEFVRHRGYYYAIAGEPPASEREDGPRRRVSHAYSAPGRLAVRGGPKAQQLYMFAAPELGFADDAEKRRVLVEQFTGMGGAVPEMLAELAEYDFYLDALARVRIPSYVSGRVALVGDSAYGNTLAGFGTGLALVGAYVLAGELAAAAGDHTVAFARYEQIMRRYAKLGGSSSPGPFLAPKTAWGLRLRNWFLGSRWFDLMDRFAGDAKDDIDLIDYAGVAPR